MTWLFRRCLRLMRLAERRAPNAMLLRGRGSRRKTQVAVALTVGRHGPGPTLLSVARFAELRQRGGLDVPLNVQLRQQCPLMAVNRHAKRCISRQTFRVVANRSQFVPRHEATYHEDAVQRGSRHSEQRFQCGPRIRLSRRILLMMHPLRAQASEFPDRQLRHTHRKSTPSLAQLSLRAGARQARHPRL